MTKSSGTGYPSPEIVLPVLPTSASFNTSSDLRVGCDTRRGYHHSFHRPTFHSSHTIATFSLSFDARSREGD